MNLLTYAVASVLFLAVPWRLRTLFPAPLSLKVARTRNRRYIGTLGDADETRPSLHAGSRFVPDPVRFSLRCSNRRYTCANTGAYILR
jgi:hypothetical protein